MTQGPMTQGKRRLGELLVERGLISEEQLREALRPELQAGRRLGEILVDQGKLSSDELNWALSELLGIPYVELSEEMVDLELARAMPEALLRRQHAVPVLRTAEGLAVLMADPTNSAAIAELEAVAGVKVRIAIASRATVDNLLDRAFPAGTAPPGAIRYGDLEAAGAQAGTDAGQASPGDAPLLDAFRAGATEVHLEPLADELRVRARVDGQLVERARLPRRVLAQTISRLRLVAGLPAARGPRQAHVRTWFERHEVELDILIFPTLHGDAATIRLFRRTDQAPTLAALDLEEATLEALSRLAGGTGMVAVTGGDARVRGALLYALARAATTPAKKVVTVERAVSYVVDDFVQVELSEDYPESAATILGHPADVFVVEDLDSAPTCAAAVSAAEQGALVLGGLGAATNTTGLTHLMSLGVPPALLLGALQGLASVQRTGSRYRVELLPVTEETRRDLSGRQGLPWTSRTS